MMVKCVVGSALVGVAVLSGVLNPALAAAETPVASAPAISVRAGGYCGHYYGDATTGRGDSGNRVREIQCILNTWNSDASLKVDGVFGPQTEEWVKYFQGAHRLPADGIVGPPTWEALRALP